ncbi:uncharacterized protein LOC134824817 [Bolinopsis microptera]|uniref:uncharacterized protein LOC134824817 n=1 Tax=Bolinopsis microptera TaxID=2820187 RepID=UPI003079D748
MVFTPHGYQVVAVFLTSKLDGDTVAEALYVVKRWNPDLSPTYSMTDIDTAEINAIQEVFPGTKHFYCDFHIKQAWEKAIKNHFKSDDIDKEIVGEQYINAEAKITAYQLLLYLMDADCPWSHHMTETLDSDFEARLLRAANHPVVLRNPGFRNYMISWSSPVERSRWAKPYRDNSAIRGIYTNNGVEALNGVLKNRVMNNSSKQGVPSLLQALVYDYLPTKLTMYRHKRMAESAGYKRILVSNNEAHFQWPLWMNGIPHKSLLRIKENYKRSATFGVEDILRNDDHFIIRTRDFSIEEYQSYHAYKVTVSPSVHCDCLNFRSYPELPCKHLLAVIRESNVEWTDLPLSFRHNPHLCTDPGASCSTQEVSLPLTVPDSLPQDQSPKKTDKNTEGDLNATFGKLADLRSMIYNVAPENRREMRDLVTSVIDGMLLPRLSEMTKIDMTVTAGDDLPLLSTTSRAEKRTDFADSLPKRAKKKRKKFPERKLDYGFGSDSDFENDV